MRYNNNNKFIQYYLFCTGVTDQNNNKQLNLWNVIINYYCYVSFVFQLLEKRN